jgi:polyisoprenoid-binding protein YceI
METTKWVIDPSHSEIQFKVKHMMISTVTGQFLQFNATIETTGDDFSTAKIEFSSDIISITTNNDQRDSHLRTSDFFDAENHPQLTFVGERLEKIDNGNFKVYGTLTMRGVARKEVFNVEYGGIITDPYGLTRAGFSLSGNVNRREYGVNFNAMTETGGIVVADEVKILVNAEFIKQKEAQAA